MVPVISGGGSSPSRPSTVGPMSHSAPPERSGGAPSGSTRRKGTGLVVCAVGAHAELGVDVEDIRRTVDLDGVARLSFSSAELAAWRALSGAEKIHRFFELWTAKEAYLKALGAGLTLPLDGFSIAFGAGAPTIAFEPGFADDATSWAFAQVALGPELRAAVAVRWSGCLTVCVSHVDPGTLSSAARLGPG